MKLIGDGVDGAEDLEWPKVAKAELVVQAPFNRRLNIWMQLDEDGVTDSEREGGSFLVSLHLHDVAHEMKVLRQYLLEPLLELWNFVGGCVLDSPMSWLVAIERGER